MAASLKRASRAGEFVASAWRTMIPPLPPPPPTTFQSCPWLTGPFAATGEVAFAVDSSSSGSPRIHLLMYGMAVTSAATKGWPQSKSNLEWQLGPILLTNFSSMSTGAIRSLVLPQTSTSFPASSGNFSQVSWPFLASSCCLRPSSLRGASAPIFSSLDKRAKFICQSIGFSVFHFSFLSLFAWKILRVIRSSTVTPGAYHRWIG
mmetsp:Transcript_7517/g.16890  ORF Transcript_7517/g.16890 Transcript_7517/m.16890 type:complete len:205 (+) Transcript_7517:194-808(+)